MFAYRRVVAASRRPRAGATQSRILSLPSLNSLITDAGDSGFLLPMALAGVAMLWIYHSRHLAWLLLRSVLLASVLIVALKVLFLSCGAHWIPGLVSPSGHACLSAVVYGTLATVVAAGRPRRVRLLIGVLASCFIVLIAVTRFTMGIHTLLEVLVGLAVGALAHWWFARSCAALAPVRVDIRSFGTALLLTLVVAFGVRLPAESMVRHLARRIAFSCDSVAHPGALAAGRIPQGARSRVRRSSASERAV
jgi:membrane-associated phospholipid phosphatase